MIVSYTIIGAENGYYVRYLIGHVYIMLQLKET